MLTSPSENYCISLHSQVRDGRGKFIGFITKNNIKRLYEKKTKIVNQQLLTTAKHPTVIVKGLKWTTLITGDVFVVRLNLR